MIKKNIILQVGISGTRSSLEPVIITVQKENKKIVKYKRSEINK